MISSEQDPKVFAEERAQAALLALARLLGRIMAHEHLRAQPNGLLRPPRDGSADPLRNGDGS